MVRVLKRLEDVIGVTVVDPLRDERGWRFLPADPDPHEGFRFLAEAYRATDPGYAGRVSVPVLVRLKYQIMRATPDHSALRKVATYRMLRVSPHQPVSPVRARAATQTADRRCTG